MRKLFIFIFINLITISTTGVRAESPSAFNILQKSDIIRNPQVSFVVDVNLKQYENSVLTDKTDVVTHSRKDERGQFLSLVYIQNPSVDRGKILLRNGTVVWMFDPKSKASVRISPKQQLMGNTSNGDVITSNFLLDYTAELEKEEEIADGDKNIRKCWKLNLKASNEYSPYAYIDLWVDKESYRPLKGMFYGQSGKLLKVAWYRGWKNVLGEERPTEVVIADGFNNKLVSVINMSNYREKELPYSWFTKEWLANFVPVN